MSNLSYSLRSYLKTPFVFFSLEKNFLYISRKLKRKKAISDQCIEITTVEKMSHFVIKIWSLPLVDFPSTSLPLLSLYKAKENLKGPSNHR